MRWRGSGAGTKPAKLTRRDARIGAGLAAAVAILLVAWLLLDDSGSDGDATSASTGAEIVSVEALRLAAEEDGPIYWVGPPAGSELELSRPSAERTYVRYLTGGAAAGDRRPFLTVGSYRLANPAAALRSQAKGGDGVIAGAPSGGVVYFSRKQPESVYLAYPGVDIEIEVFAPNFQQALQLVTSGRIVPVE